MGRRQVYMARGLAWMLGVLIALGSVAEARPHGKRRGARRKRKDEVPTSEAVDQALGGLKWGASPKEVVQFVAGQLKEEYKPKVKATRDPMEKNALRQEYKDKMEAFQKSLVEFDGGSTNWDASYLEGEYTHGNRESMLVRRDDNSQNFYFFIRGRLWKWYKAFDADVFPAKNFAQFSSVVQKKFGQGKVVEPTADSPPAVVWQGTDSHLAAIDKTQFYGFYGLIFEDKQTRESLASLRKSGGRSKKDSRASSLVDSVTGESSLDGADRPDIVDQLTGKRRDSGGGRAAKAPSRSSRGAGGSARDDAEAPAAPVQTGDRSVDTSDDPLEGLL